MAATLDDVLSRLDRIIGLLESQVIQNERRDRPATEAPVPVNPVVLPQPVRFDQPMTDIPHWSPPPYTPCKGDENG